MPTELDTPARHTAKAMSRAATAWLAELDEEQASLGWWGSPGGDDESERLLWYYTPTDHGGLPLNGQFVRQQRRAMELVASGLSPEGYALASTIMGNENILDRVEGFSTEFDTRRGRDPSRYYLRVFGDPTGPGLWGWRFGGHHLSLNFLIVEGEVRSSTPRFFGLDPAVTSLPGNTKLDPLHAFQQTGRQLVNSLSPEARGEAVLLDRAPSDIVLGNRSSFQDGATMLKLDEVFRRRPGDEDLIERMRIGGIARDAETGYGPLDHRRLAITCAPKGIAGADLDVQQKDLLDRLITVYHEGLPAGLAPAWNIDTLHFAWAGPTGTGMPNYYRVQGDDLLIEWDNTARNANHAHGVVRHLSNDFGGDVLGEHRKALHHSQKEALQ